MSLNDLLEYRITSPDPPRPLKDYLSGWYGEAELNENVAGRMLRAIGEEKKMDTSPDSRYGRIFSNRPMSRYPRFAGLVGVEEPLNKIVQFLKHAAQGLEQEKQVLALLGPVGAGKSTIVEMLKRFYEELPVWVLGVMVEGEKKPKLSPVFENPLGLFERRRYGERLEKEFKVPLTRLKAPMSQWAALQLEKHDGDLSKFVAVKVIPSMVTRTCIARIAPGELRSADIGRLIGRRDRSGKLDDYQYSGGLNRTTQGILELVEVFTANPDMLKPLLEVTQDRKYAGDGEVGELPYEGIPIIHSNVEDWEAFRDGKHSAKYVDRICRVDVPYNLRVTEEVAMYERYLEESGLKGVPRTPRSLEIPAIFGVSTRLVSHAKMEEKLRIYDGRTPLEWVRDNKLSADDFRKAGEWRDGMQGVTTRAMFKALPLASELYPKDAFDPVTFLEILEAYIVREKTPHFSGRTPEDIIKKDVRPRVQEIVSQAIQHAYMADYDAFVLERFTAYSNYSDAWMEDQEFKEPGSDEIRTRDWMEQKLSAIEKKVGVTSPKDYRFELNKKVLRFLSNPDNRGKPAWLALEDHVWFKLERALVPDKDEMSPTIKFGERQNSKDEVEHFEFMSRLKEQQNCSDRQARQMVEWYIKNCP